MEDDLLASPLPDQRLVAETVLQILDGIASDPRVAEAPAPVGATVAAVDLVATGALAVSIRLVPSLGERQMARAAEGNRRQHPEGYGQHKEPGHPRLRASKAGTRLLSLTRSTLTVTVGLKAAGEDPRSKLGGPSTMNSKRSLTLLALATALIAAGCGGDDEDTTAGVAPAPPNIPGATTAPPDTTAPPTTTGALAPDEYEQRLGEILVPLSAELNRLDALAAQASSSEELAARMNDGVATLQSAIDELNAIAPPAEITGPHAAMIASIENFKSSTEAFAAVAAGGDDAAIETALSTFEASVPTFQAEFQGAIADMQAAGIQPRAP